MATIHVIASTGVEGFRYSFNSSLSPSYPADGTFDDDAVLNSSPYITGLLLSTSYTHPVWVRHGSGLSQYDFQMTNADGTYRDRNIAMWTSARTVYLQATYKQSYSHAITYYSQGIYYTTDSWSDSSQTIDGRAISASPTRTGYKLIGWDTSSSASTVVYTSTVYADTANISLYAVWKRLTSHSVRYLNGSTVFYTDSWSDENAYITARPVYSGTPTKSGYTFRYWQSSTGNQYVSGQTITEDLASVDLTAVFTAKIGLFYWDGNDGSQDANLIKAGQPFSNLTAERWNTMNAKIKQINPNYVYTDVTKNVTEMTAAIYNGVRNAIGNLTGHGTLPPIVSQGGTIYASYFQGSQLSLKSALNDAITYYNTH